MPRDKLQLDRPQRQFTYLAFVRFRRRLSPGIVPGHTAVDAAHGAPVNIDDERRTAAATTLPQELPENGPHKL